MNAWARAAGKLARYEHIGWSEWPHSRDWSFQSAATPSSGRTGSGDSARGSGSWSTLTARAILGRSLLAGERAAEHSTGDSLVGRLEMRAPRRRLRRRSPGHDLPASP